MSERDGQSIAEEVESSGGGSGSGVTPQTQTQTQTSKETTCYCDNYFNINDIVANSGRVASTALVPIPCAGPVLDPCGESADIGVGTKLELPLWLARELHSERLIDLSLPKGFNRTYREILEADANCVDLHKLGPNYYLLGQHLAHMALDESQDIAHSLVHTFHQRYHRLVNYSLSATDDTISQIQNFRQQLDNEEKCLFSAGKESLDQMKDWEKRTIDKVVPNDLVVQMRKRKRIVCYDSKTSSQTTQSSINSQTN